MSGIKGSKGETGRIGAQVSTGWQLTLQLILPIFMLQNITMQCDLEDQLFIFPVSLHYLKSIVMLVLKSLSLLCFC